MSSMNKKTPTQLAEGFVPRPGAATDEDVLKFLTNAKVVREKHSIFWEEKCRAISWDQCCEFLNDVEMEVRFGPTSFRGEWALMQNAVGTAKNFIDFFLAVKFPAPAAAELSAGEIK